MKLPRTVLTLAPFLALAWGAGNPLQAATPVLWIHVSPAVREEVEVDWVPVNQGGNADNAFIKINQGNQKGEVDLLRTLGYGKNDISHIESGDWRLEFTGFRTYCSPRLRLILDDGSNHPPSIKFTAKGDITSTRIKVVDATISGPMGAFTIEPDGSISVSEP